MMNVIRNSSRLVMWLLVLMICFTGCKSKKKAAEAAFAGRPFNPKWSDAARIVYDGLLAAMGKEARSVEMHDELEPVEPLA